MIFISRKHFEEEVMQRIGKAMDDEYNRRRLCDLQEQIDKLACRVNQLEYMTGTPSKPPVSGSVPVNLTAVTE